jgi:hypothetical protein
MHNLEVLISFLLLIRVVSLPVQLFLTLSVLINVRFYCYID